MQNKWSWNLCHLCLHAQPCFAYIVRNYRLMENHDFPYMQEMEQDGVLRRNNRVKWGEYLVIVVLQGSGSNCLSELVRQILYVHHSHNHKSKTKFLIPSSISTFKPVHRFLTRIRQKNLKPKSPQRGSFSRFWIGCRRNGRRLDPQESPSIHHTYCNLSWSTTWIEWIELKDDLIMKGMEISALTTYISAAQTEKKWKKEPRQHFWTQKTRNKTQNHTEKRRGLNNKWLTC